MVKFRLVGGPRHDEVVYELPDGYRSQGTGSGAGSHLNFEVLMTAKYTYDIPDESDDAPGAVSHHDRRADER